MCSSAWTRGAPYVCRLRVWMADPVGEHDVGLHPRGQRLERPVPVGSSGDLEHACSCKEVFHAAAYIALRNDLIVARYLP